MTPYLLPLSILISAILFIRADFKQISFQKYLFKPLTTILILGFAFLQVAHISDSYKNYILLGLFFSLWGDIFLMLPKDRFISGLISFFIAHLFYIAAFVSDSGWFFHWVSFFPILLYILIFLKILVPHTGSKTIPVIFYAFILFVLLWQSTGRFFYSESPGVLFAFIGSIFFIASDSILALNRFVKVKKIKGAQLFIMSTYYFSQFLIAASI